MAFLVFASGLSKAQVIPLAQEKDTAVISAALKDTASILLRSPSADKEKSVFSDPKLRYKKNTRESPGFFSRLLDWISEKLFDNVNEESVYRTRQIIIWTIVIISVVVIVRLLLRSEFTGLTRSSSRSVAFSFADVTENLDTVNFDKKTDEALLNGDYRLATRWLYLKMLYLLNKKQHIAFAPFKTNIDYKYELKGKFPEAGFIALSRIYEYVWYGQFVTTPDRYRQHEAEFKDYEKQLHV